jgi:hypothetical protein
MRAVVRAYLAGHPVLTFGLIVGRWVLWMAAGHPVGLVGGVIAMALDRSLFTSVVFAVVIDALLFGVGSVWQAGPARRYWVWVQGARFRRRWPSTFAEAYIQPEFDRAAVFPGNYYSAPDGLRPVWVAPRLSLLPRRLNHQDIRWAVRPWSAQSFGEIAAQAGRLAGADDRVARADLVRRKHSQRRRWDLVVAFSERVADPDDGWSIPGGGYTPAASGDSPGVASPPHRGRRPQQTNGSSPNGHFGAVRSSSPEQAKETWRVVHDVRYRKNSWNE